MFPRSTSRFLPLVLALLTACAAPGVAEIGREDAVPSTAPSPLAPAATAALRRVPAEEVCMRSNRFLGKPQIPTEIEGRPYFGCCSGCNQALHRDPAARTATDPISGQPVDKGSAVIGARPDGGVVYFESEETFSRAGGA